MKFCLLVAVIAYALVAPMTSLIALDPRLTAWSDPWTYAWWGGACAATGLLLALSGVLLLAATTFEGRL